MYCTCNVALRHIHVVIVAVEKKQLLNIMSTFMRFCLSDPHYIFPAPYYTGLVKIMLTLKL
jgi:hypothetical protein